MPTLASKQANFLSFKRTCSIEIDSELIEILSAFAIKTQKLVELETSHEHEQLFSRDEKSVSPLQHLRWFWTLRSLLPVFACLATFCASFSSTSWLLPHFNGSRALQTRLNNSAFCFLLCRALFASEHSKARRNLKLITVPKLWKVICS